MHYADWGCKTMSDRPFARKILCKGFLNENEASVSSLWFVAVRRKTVYNVRKVNDFWTEYPSLVVNIRDVSRSPMSDHRYPPPLRHVARLEATDPWLQTTQHFLGWRTDYQFGHWCIHQSLISTTIVTPSPLTPASSRAAAPPWQIVVRLLAPKLDKWSRGGGH